MTSPEHGAPTSQGQAIEILKPAQIVGDAIPVAVSEDLREPVAAGPEGRPEILGPTPVVNDALRWTVTRSLLWVFGFSVAATYAIIVLRGLRFLDYPDSFLHWLGGATVGQTAGLLALVVRDLFPHSAENKRNI